MGRPGAAESPRARLHGALLARRGEIERAIATRIHAIGDPTEAADPTYAESLRASLRTALDYGLEAVERGEERASPVPTTLLAQARIAARNSVSLDIVLRRYLAGYTLLVDFLIRSAEECDLQNDLLQRVTRTEAALFDRLIAAVTEEYARESKDLLPSSAQKHAERIERLLAGELIDVAQIAYDFEGWHLGLVAAGPEVERSLRRLATDLDCRPLILRREEGKVWAWLGTRRNLGSAELKNAVAGQLGPDHTVALGEPAEELSGWRLTHRQASAAFTITQRGHEPVVRYSDVTLLASLVQDELVVSSLRKLYLEPLANEGSSGETLRETLRAYFAAGRNISSAAATLEVNRNTVAYRLRAVEDSLGRPLSSCSVELETAIRLERFLEPLA